MKHTISPTSIIIIMLYLLCVEIVIIGHFDGYIVVCGHLEPSHGIPCVPTQCQRQTKVHIHLQPLVKQHMSDNRPQSSVLCPKRPKLKHQ